MITRGVAGRAGVVALAVVLGLGAATPDPGWVDAGALMAPEPSAPAIAEHVASGPPAPVRLTYRAAGGSGRPSAAGVVDVITDRGGGTVVAATGIVLNPSLVVTAAHVVDGARMIWVGGTDGDCAYPARVVGIDDALDVALLRVPAADPLVAARLGDSVTVGRGDLVEVIGNAGGRGPLRQTRSRVWDTAAVIGSTDPVEASRGPAGSLVTGTFALDGGVVAGDSGGAVLDRHGQVVAMILAYTPTWCDRSGAGCGGYAIPIDRVLGEGVGPVIGAPDGEQSGSG